jgi:serine phosphatase RsbU (regulator of sigma subunit)
VKWGELPGLAPILDALAEAVTIRDRQDHILYANRAAVENMGFASLEEMQAQPLQSIMDRYIVIDEHGDAVTMDDIPSVRLLAGKDAEPLLIRTTHRETGQIHWQLLKATLLRDDDGAPAATVTIIEDVTTEKTIELRDRFLARASDTLMTSIDYEETLTNVAWLAVPEIADWCGVDLLDETGARQQVVVAHPNPLKLPLAERLRSYEPESGDDSASIRVARTGVAELYNDITEEMLAATARDSEHLKLLRAVGFRSALIAPMRARGRTLGVMTLVTAESMRRYDEGDKEFAEQLAGRAAIAVDNARLATARRETALTLQRSLLPDGVPAIDGWSVGTMYRPASTTGEIEVGGDFYDFIETRMGWIVLLGDVTGRGVQAAAMTSLMRHGARFIARAEPDPGAILTGLDEALREQSELALCSALCLRLEDDQIVMSSAGHPLPLLVGDDGEVQEVGRTGPLLGGWEGSSWEDHVVPIASDQTLVTYTDGVTDTRGEEARFGPARLHELLSSHAGESPPALLAELHATLDRFQVPGRSDDTAAVALRPIVVREQRSAPGSGEHAFRAS